MTTLRIETGSAEETIAAGGRIAAKLQPGMLIILRGELGAGKTTFMKGVAQALHAASPDEVTSPTFTLIHEYEGRMDAGAKIVPKPVRLYHLDLYRLETERQLASLGLEELAAEDAIMLVEWGEKFPSIIQRSAGEVVIEHAGGDKRTIHFSLRESPLYGGRPRSRL